MAHIFKYPKEGNKGIVVFTHKEMLFLNSLVNVSGKLNVDKVFRLVAGYFLSHLNKAKKKRILNCIQEKYLIGVHWGWFAEGVKTPDWVDFHMSAEGTVAFVDSPYVIPMSSSHFTPKVMTNTCENKYWDIICVAKNSKIKNYEQLLGSIRKIYDLGYSYRVLFVIASNTDEDEGGYYTSILDDYFEMFSAEEREWLSIIKSSPDTGFQGFSYSLLSHFYNQSKVFTVFSQQEGECRVIKEAQLCGLPVVVKSDLSGGGRDYLTVDNSYYFDSYEVAHDALIYAVENYSEFDCKADDLVGVLGEDASVQRLHEYFSKLFAKNSMDYDGCLVNLDNLNRRLPAHYYDKSISWASDPSYRFLTTDINNMDMLDDFSRELKLKDD